MVVLKGVLCIQNLLYMRRQCRSRECEQQAVARNVNAQVNLTAMYEGESWPRESEQRGKKEGGDAKKAQHLDVVDRRCWGGAGVVAYLLRGAICWQARRTDFSLRFPFSVVPNTF